ncbi:hypothetical protein [Streptomyces sp. SM10]|uniref:hypothetical protein n=1 Tax=Streptomyces sp. SM10 TaxID=565556 RepID=UPI0015E161E6|nr:hypothetical protein [Streptomyces sp. SM10]
MVKVPASGGGAGGRYRRRSGCEARFPAYRRPAVIAVMGSRVGGIRILTLGDEIGPDFR